ncbi:Hypothetical protein NTJ_14911 [Nesidiocoris tenuis]|uniref:C2 domain-containing protein n=2 Tax=Nesidiocoris tenuis TaxID=355587 RepID=A0ABN7BCR5_9HEMI|nr:Hypothetical protein NTJ_14911 [Nesidiocoris tenuis]
MVASAVLGAATGTGLALLVAMTLVVYRYYSSRRYSKDWGDVERFSTGYLSRQTSGTSGGGSGKRRPGGPPAGITVSSQKVFNVAKEETTVQPSSPPNSESVAPALEVTGGLQATVCRTPSLSSHPSIESNISRQSVMRTLSPDVRSEGSRTRPLSPLLLPQDSTSSITTISSMREMPMSPLPLGTLQPALYTRPEGPLVVRSDNSAGRIHFTAKYDLDRSDLHVHLIEGDKLVGGEFSEPYIRLSLDPPVDNRVRQVPTSKASPILDQPFKFPVPHDDLDEYTLVIQVFDYDRYSRNDVIGELRLDLAEVDTTSSVEIWADIDKIKKPREDHQEILVSLSYLPSAERLTVCLLKARNLYLPQNRDTIDPFVKVYLLANGKRIKKKKTACRKGTSNPVWNEAITFNISSVNLSASSIEVCVMDQGCDILGGPVLVGSVLIGPDTDAHEHWNQMAASPRKAVALWQPLR